MDFIQHNILMVVLAVVSGSLLLFTSLRRGGGHNAVTPTQATILINRENAQVVDVRESDDYVSGHLPEARNIPEARLEERVGELDKFKDTPLILVCQSGGRTAAACKKLEGLGFNRVHSLDGGINAWREAGLPLKRGSKK